MTTCQKLLSTVCACVLTLTAAVPAEAMVVMGGFEPPAFVSGVEASAEWEDGSYLWRYRHAKIAELSGAPERLSLPTLTSVPDEALLSRFGEAYTFTYRLRYRFSIGGKHTLTLYNPYCRSTRDNFFLYRVERDGTLANVTGDCTVEKVDGIPYSFSLEVDSLEDYVLSSLLIEEPVGLNRLVLGGSYQFGHYTCTLEKSASGNTLHFNSESAFGDEDFTVSLTAGDWERLELACAGSGVHGWLPAYWPPFQVFDSLGWEFDAEFTDGSVVNSSGYAITPTNYYDIDDLVTGWLNNMP